MYVGIAIILTVYSWGFVDRNSPLQTLSFLYELVYEKRIFSGIVFSGMTILFFAVYLRLLYLAQANKIKPASVFRLLILISVILVFSFPAFSNDIFNYIATAKVTYLYQENPYLVMPIEIPNESMLSFLHASNKVALYGPVWILLTGIPHLLGAGNLLLTLFAFKVFVMAFYWGLTWLIWKMTRNLRSVVLFAFNPLVLTNTLIDGHNDIVMMFLAVMSFYLLTKRRFGLAAVFLLSSILIKGATVFLVPVFLWVVWRRTERIDWQRVWYLCALSLYAIFFLSPLREEMYSWYFIWPLAFVALRGSFDFLTLVSLAISLGLSFRFAPFAFTRNWGGRTPLIKNVVTIGPAVFTALWYAIRKKI